MPRGIDVLQGGPEGVLGYGEDVISGYIEPGRTAGNLKVAKVVGKADQRLQSCVGGDESAAGIGEDCMAGAGLVWFDRCDLVSARHRELRLSQDARGSYQTHVDDFGERQYGDWTLSWALMFLAGESGRRSCGISGGAWPTTSKRTSLDVIQSGPTHCASETIRYANSQAVYSGLAVLSVTRSSTVPNC